MDVARIASRLESSLEKNELRTAHRWWEVAFCPRRRQFFFYFDSGGNWWRQWDYPDQWNHLYDARIVIFSTDEPA